MRVAKVRTLTLKSTMYRTEETSTSGCTFLMKMQRDEAGIDMASVEMKTKNQKALGMVWCWRLRLSVLGPEQ
ncbi:hypothetical protein HYQ44_016348 [Verticillium longisporum]|nr:hypothetical protein HYQ44_016348 [Verticillium longisporum]